MEARALEKITAFQGLRGYAALGIFLSHYPFLLNAAAERNAFSRVGGLGVEILLSSAASLRQCRQIQVRMTVGFRH